MLGREGSIVNHQMQFARKEDAPVWGLSNASAVFDSQGNVKEFYGFCVGITEPKRMERLYSTCLRVV